MDMLQMMMMLGSRLGGACVMLCLVPCHDRRSRSFRADGFFFFF
jgi:hypothetical protein